MNDKVVALSSMLVEIHNKYIICKRKKQIAVYLKNVKSQNVKESIII